MYRNTYFDKYLFITAVDEVTKNMRTGYRKILRILYIYI